MSVIATRRVVLSITAAKITDADARRRVVVVKNEDGAIIVRVGPAGVTAAATPATAGLAISPGDTLTLASYPGIGAGSAAAELWAIAESGTPAISILQATE